MLSLFDRDVSEEVVVEGEAISATMVGEWWESPLGKIIAVSEGDALVWLSFEGESGVEATLDRVVKRLGFDVEMGSDLVLKKLWGELGEYFDGCRSEFGVPLRMRGTAFQKSVWEELMRVEYGQTISYSGLAEKLGVKNGQRAVGKANGDNPISVIVPCHRVVRADGDLCGYAGGLWRKQRLLGIESGQPGLF